MVSMIPEITTLVSNLDEAENYIVNHGCENTQATLATFQLQGVAMWVQEKQGRRTLHVIRRK